MVNFCTTYSLYILWLWSIYIKAFGSILLSTLEPNLDFSRGTRLFWAQNDPRYHSFHLRGQKSLGHLEKSRFCARTI